jgi:formate-dependent nitrite reductase membrane component NrfD
MRDERRSDLNDGGAHAVFANAFLTPLIPRANDDDAAGHGHRQAIGVLGMLLPLAIWILDRSRPTPALEPEELASISAYFWSGGVVAFAGILSALAVYLIIYEGYRTADGHKDRWASTVAGWSAALVVLFPTDPPGDTPDPAWWSEWIGRTHYSAAIVLFLSFAYFCLFRFPKSSSEGPIWSAEARASWDQEKWIRNILYLGSGLGILVALALAGLAGRRHEPIFWQEVVAVELFALSWLVKGQADRTALQLAGRGAFMARHPVKAMDRMRDGGAGGSKG